MVNIRRGFMMAELIIVSVIFICIMVAGMVFNEPLKFNLSMIEKRYDAINLASSQLEDLKEVSELDWDDPEIADTGGASRDATASITMPEGYTITYTVADKTDWTEDDLAGVDQNGPEYKEVVVTCVYPGSYVLTPTTPMRQLRIKGYLVKI